MQHADMIRCSEKYSANDGMYGPNDNPWLFHGAFSLIKNHSEMDLSPLICFDQSFLFFRKRKRRKEIVELLRGLLQKHRHETIYLVWDIVITHSGEEVEQILRVAAGRLVLLYLPTHSPWLNPIDMLWRHVRREVTHGELFESVDKLIQASMDFFQRKNREPHNTLSIIGAT